MHKALHARKKESKEDKGVQRTPGFVASAVQDVVGLVAGGVTELSEELIKSTPWRPPQAGWTDVGLHTGHVCVRQTSWPLVREVLKVRPGFSYWGAAVQTAP
jgi:hypothetical protein